MARICAILVLVFGSVSAQDSYVSFGEGFSLGENQDAIIVGYRILTTTSLLEFFSRGVLIDRLEVSPREITLRVGDNLSLSQIRATVFNSRGRIVESVPLNFYLEGPEDLLDFEEFRVDGDIVTAVKPGAAKIWVEPLPPSRDGERIRASIDVLVE